MRYTDVEITPASEWITASQGQFRFDTRDGSPPNAIEAGHGQIRMLYQKRVVTFRWYQVPYTHITSANSNIAAGLGYVNQFDFTGPDGTLFPAGTLLFFAVKVNRYVPPVPYVFTQPSTTIYANNKLCDIEFAMMQVNQPIAANASSDMVYHTMADWSPNNIIAGHNLLPYAHTGAWYYARTDITKAPASHMRPMFPSYPFELLWTTPQ
jgi:hypothetical protein